MGREESRCLLAGELYGERKGEVNVFVADQAEMGRWDNTEELMKADDHANMRGAESGVRCGLCVRT